MINHEAKGEASASQVQLNELGELASTQLIGGDTESFVNNVVLGSKNGIPILASPAAYNYEISAAKCWEVVPTAAAILEISTDREGVNICHMPAQYLAESPDAVYEGYFPEPTRPLIEFRIRKAADSPGTVAEEHIVLFKEDTEATASWRLSVLREVWDDTWREGQILETHMEEGEPTLPNSTCNALKAIIDNIGNLVTE